MHDGCPTSGWYSPGAHPVQLPAPAADTLPASHVNGATAPVGHAEPAGHAVQWSTVVAFAAPFQVPGGQGDAAAAAASQNEPVGQSTQPVARADG